MLLYFSLSSTSLKMDEKGRTCSKTATCLYYCSFHLQCKIKNRLKSGNACYYSVQNLLSSSLLFRNLKIKIYRITVFAVVLFRCDKWSLTLRDERRVRLFENRVFRRIFGPKRDEVTGNWRELHNEELNDL